MLVKFHGVIFTKAFKATLKQSEWRNDKEFFVEPFFLPLGLEVEVDYTTCRVCHDCHRSASKNERPFKTWQRQINVKEFLTKWRVCLNLDVHKQGWWSKYSVESLIMTNVILQELKRTFFISLDWILSKAEATSFGISGPVSTFSSKSCWTRSDVSSASFFGSVEESRISWRKL